MHDFKNFPELTNGQMETEYFSSPHKQIFEDFRAKCVKVTDGDTITVKWFERDFNFPIRFLDINTKELSEGGGDVKDWLKDIIEGEEVDILINKKNRVDKWGRLLGHIVHRGMNMGEWMLRTGKATTFANRNEGKITELNKLTSKSQWF